MLIALAAMSNVSVSKSWMPFRAMRLVNRLPRKMTLLNVR